MFFSEGSALEQIRTGDPKDPRTIAARVYLRELRKALKDSAARLKGI